MEVDDISHVGSNEGTPTNPLEEPFGPASSVSLIGEKVDNEFSVLASWDWLMPAHEPSSLLNIQDSPHAFSPPIDDDKTSLRDLDFSSPEVCATFFATTSTPTQAPSALWIDFETPDHHPANIDYAISNSAHDELSCDDFFSLETDDGMLRELDISYSELDSGALLVYAPDGEAHYSSQEPLGRDTVSLLVDNCFRILELMIMSRTRIPQPHINLRTIWEASILCPLSKAHSRCLGATDAFGSNW
jgi:hypothetical protein